MRRWIRTCALLGLAVLALSCRQGSPVSSVGEIATPAPAAAHTPAAVLAGKWVLVNFGAPWCPVCKQLEPELAYFPKEQPNVAYRHVDIDQRDSELHKRYFHDYFKGRRIPFTVLIDPSGKAVKEWTGYLSYEEMVSQIAQIDAKTE